MSTLNVDSIVSSAGANTATINGATPTVYNTMGRNIIINGAMEIAQRGTSATVENNSNEGYSTVDRWFLNFNNGCGGAVTFSQSSDAPLGFASSAKIQCSTTYTSYTDNQYIALQQRFEGRNLQLLGYGQAGAKDMTLSWYMKTETYTGPISVAFYTIDGTAEYFTVSVTPTTSWAKYSLTIPGSTTATINNNSDRGMDVQFVFGAHTPTISAPADSTAWSTTRADYRDNVGNLLSSTSNAIYITGVQLEVGSVATEFEHRPYGMELALCQRYYQVVVRGLGNSVGSGSPYQNGQGLYVPWQFRQEFRATPTLISSGAGTFRARHGDLVNFSGFIGVNSMNNKNATLITASVSGSVVGDYYWLEADDASALLAFDAEL